MPEVPLIRDSLKDIYANNLNSDHPTNKHAGLLLDRGFLKYDENQSTLKSDFINKLCQTESSSLYINEFIRWLNLTKDPQNPEKPSRFCQTLFSLENRLLIGLHGASALETGCMINHHNGMPYIPGSSVKGAVRHWARKHLSDELEKIWIKFFGSNPEDTDNDPFSGLVTFHDAWWVPNSAPTASSKASNKRTKSQPFINEIVTTHHLEYYSNEGDTKASDLDDPIPNALIGVHGSFLFTLEGEKPHTDIVKILLEKTLKESGIGAKTSAGYGYFEDASNDLKNRVAILIHSDNETNKEQSVSPALKYEVSQLRESKIIKMFSQDRGSTKKREDYEPLCKLIGEQFYELISQWETETQKTSKNRFRAYGILKDYLPEAKNND
ncbi:type III-B CRISPR module RAMP protein Cmr6 [Marinomonas mediterranea]|uniref:type III-B CRISPR module RAMP protein Cmr6 n=1 Tax=Marinomonas mediterranea TaxID=119864 RepID=UPI00234B99AB|nr:type III-B CRISPR module RAMP protein Cmr6 [Marinomonas mediterranea]WCN08276.1 type III-B CRISPR module RAMP protein Cmr6 [Marinomonas mediterranea]